MIDVHAHIVEAQHGGLILSVEGDPPVPEGHPYDWHKAQPYGETFVVAPYLTADKRHADSDIIYIHCRRNGFTPDQIAAYLAGSASKVVVLDTFYKFVWKPVDFFHLLARFRDRHFLLTHGGGYDIHEMLQVVRYSPNAFVDFSATQEIFGCVTGQPDLDIGVSRLIRHALAEPRIRSKVVFGSDNPEFSQAAAIAWYRGTDPALFDLFDANYARLISPLKAERALAQGPAAGTPHA